MARCSYKTLGYQVLQIAGCAVASALAQAGNPTITVIQNKNSDVAFDWLIVLATALGALLLLVLLLVELWRCCKLDHRRRKIRGKLRAGIPVEVVATRPPNKKKGRTGNTVNIDEEAQLQKALSLSRATAEVEEEARQIRLAIDASLGYSVPAQTSHPSTPMAAAGHYVTPAHPPLASRHSYTPSVSSVSSVPAPTLLPPYELPQNHRRSASYAPPSAYSSSSGSGAPPSYHAPMYPSAASQTGASYSTGGGAAYAPLYPSARTKAADTLSTPAPAYTPSAEGLYPVPLDAYSVPSAAGAYPSVHGDGAGEVQHGYDPYAAPASSESGLYPKPKPRPPPRQRN